MPLSHRHHYIPQFLLRNFTDEKDDFYVYDKQKKSTKRKKTNDVFFSWDRNTVTVRDKTQNCDVELDNLEQLYSALDSQYAIDLAKVLQHGKPEPEQIASIVLLASSLKWRTTTSDSQFDLLKHDTTLKDLAVRIEVRDEVKKPNPVALEHLLNSDLFKEAKRFMLPILPLMKGEKMLEIHNNSFIQHCSDPRASALVGDCALLEQGGQGYDELGHFVFPLSTTATFVYKKSTHLEVNSNLFYLCRDLATLHFSKKYVACKDASCLHNLVAEYERIKNQPQLGDYLLRMLFASV